MMRKRFGLLSSVLLLVIMLVLTGCGGDNKTPSVNNQPQVSASSNSPIVKIGADGLLDGIITLDGTFLSSRVEVESVTINFYFHSNMSTYSEVKTALIKSADSDIVYSQTFALNNVTLSPNGTVEIDLSKLNLSDLFKELDEEEIHGIVKAEFIFSFDSISPITIELDMLAEDLDIISASLPVIFISAGQSGGVYVTDAICQNADIPYDRADAPTGVHLESGTGLPGYDPNDPTQMPVQIEKNSNVADGTPYETVVFVIGASELGMAASGLTIETELERIEDNIAWAEENDVTIIGIHVEGQSLRGNDTEAIIDAVLPHCDMIIASASSNYDNKFSNFAQSNDIACRIVGSTALLIPIFQNIFLL